jgi:lipopolysaccharide transport system ATP-binding protein
LVGALTNVVKSPFKNFNRLRRLDTFKNGHTESDDTLWALKDVSFDVQEGEVVGIIGRNGAGKSTLLKILSRITEPTSGRVKIRGRVSSLLEVGTGFHPDLTGRENIYMNGTILGMTKREIDRKFDEIVDFSGVERFLDTPVKRFSSGMQVRLAFAVAAHLEPEILIIDEVLAVGDAEFQKKCLGKMQDVAEHGRTVLFVSHNMAAVSNLCSRAIVVMNGSLTMDRDVKSAVDSYISACESFRPNASRSLHTYRDKWCRNHIQAVSIDGVPFTDTVKKPLGAPLKVSLEFTSTNGEPIQNPVMGLVFHSLSKGMVAVVNTRMTGSSISSGQYHAGTIECNIPKLPFLQGNYLVDVLFGNGRSNLDLLKQYLVVEIMDTDYYGTGHSPSANQGTVFLDANWLCY